MYLSLVLLFFNTSIIITIIYAASSASIIAQETAAILSKVMDNCNDEQKLDFVYFMAQVRARNLKLRNFLFEVDWSTFLTVS